MYSFDKTDTTSVGVDIFVGRTYNSLCPVVVLLQYLAVGGFSPGPLFCWQDGSPLTRPVFVDSLCSLLQEAGVNPSGHSFRIGTATTAAANSLSDVMLPFNSWIGGRVIRLPTTFALPNKN